MAVSFATDRLTQVTQGWGVFAPRLRVLHLELHDCPAGPPPTALSRITDLVNVHVSLRCTVSFWL